MKMCNKCNQEKALEEFKWRDKSKGIRQSYCVSCRKVMDQKRFQDPVRKQQIKENKKNLQNRKKDLVWSVISSASCADCGNNNPLVLEFDHVSDDKTDSISVMMRNLHSDETILKEIEKCDVVCANCHRIRTYVRSQNWRYVRMAE